MSYNLKALKQYQTVDVSSAVHGASQHKLISMLLDGAITALARAKGMIERQDMQGKTAQINKVTDIIVGLKGSLDVEKGGEIAANLDELYNYMIRQVMLANRSNDPAPLAEVGALLTEIKTGWDEMPDEVKA